MNTIAKSTVDWAGNARSNILAWWIPKGAIIAALFAPVPARAAVWIVALIWMGTACISPRVARRQFLRLAYSSRCHCLWQLDYFVCDRAGVGTIFVTETYPYLVSLCGQHVWGGVVSAIELAVMIGEI